MDGLWIFSRIPKAERSKLVVDYLKGDIDKVVGVIRRYEVDNGALAGCSTCGSSTTNAEQRKRARAWVEYAIKNRLLID